MLTRPPSDRRPRDPDPAQMHWEVRTWTPPEPPEPDEIGWRTVGWASTHDDAARFALSLTDGDSPRAPYAEIWGPSGAATGPSRACERFPEPSDDERREMFLRAAEDHFSDGLDEVHVAR